MSVMDPTAPSEPLARLAIRPRGRDRLLGLAGAARTDLGGDDRGRAGGTRACRRTRPTRSRRALRDVGDRFWRRTLPATVVTREGWAPWVFVHVPDGTGARLTIDLEDGREWEVRQVHHLVEPR